MCERERKPEEGENEDSEKRSATDLARLPQHLTPLFSKTVVIYAAFLKENKTKSGLFPVLAHCYYIGLFIKLSPGSVGVALKTVHLFLSFTAGAKYRHGNL